LSLQNVIVVAAIRLAVAGRHQGGCVDALDSFYACHVRLGAESCP